LAEYIERRDGNGVLEVMAYSGVMKIKEEFFTYPNPTKVPRYRRVLIIPLPPDFDWRKLDNIDLSKPHVPNSILVMEDREWWKRKGRKRARHLTAFLDRPGSTTVMEVTFTGMAGKRSKVWIDREKFMAITKRNLYVDRFYVEQIFNKG
jgi:hypothetical protein